MISCSSSPRLVEYMSAVDLLFLSPPPLTSRPSALPHSPPVDRAVVGNQRRSMVDKVHLLDYATHEVPLPLFGLGHDWACTFCGAPLPHCGQAMPSMSSRVHIVKCLHPNSALAMIRQTLRWTSWAFSLTDSHLGSKAFRCCHYTFLVLQHVTQQHIQNSMCAPNTNCYARPIRATRRLCQHTLKFSRYNKRLVMDENLARCYSRVGGLKMPRPLFHVYTCLAISY